MLELWESGVAAIGRVGEESGGTACGCFCTGHEAASPLPPRADGQVSALPSLTPVRAQPCSAQPASSNFGRFCLGSGGPATCPDTPSS